MFHACPFHELSYATEETFPGYDLSNGVGAFSAITDLGY
jgi:hypothetical protein